MSELDTFSRQTLLAVETSQIWKDLQRDAVAINGELIRGESGTEAMVGALMRHIMDRVEIVRSIDDDVRGANGSKARNGNGDRHHKDSVKQKKVFSRFDITEAQTLACARDILILCNRTQSGGDTYFCVDSLLCDKSKDLCIITPLAAEADPIAINVDIVKGVENQSMDDVNGNHTDRLLYSSRPRSRTVATSDALDVESLLAFSSDDPIFSPAGRISQRDAPQTSNRASVPSSRQSLSNRESYDSFENLTTLTKSHRTSLSSENLSKYSDYGTTDSQHPSASSSISPPRQSQSESGTPLKQRYRRNTEDMHLNPQPVSMSAKDHHHPSGRSPLMNRPLPQPLQSELLLLDVSSGQPSPLDSYPATLGPHESDVDLDIPVAGDNANQALDSTESSLLSASEILQAVRLADAETAVTSISHRQLPRPLPSDHDEDDASAIEDAMASTCDNASVASSDITGRSISQQQLYQTESRSHISTNPSEHVHERDDLASSYLTATGVDTDTASSVDGEENKHSPTKRRFKVSTGKSFFKSISKSFAPHPPLTGHPNAPSSSTAAAAKRNNVAGGDEIESRGSTLTSMPPPSPFTFFRGRNSYTTTATAGNPSYEERISTADRLRQLPSYTAETLFSPMRKVASIAANAAANPLKGASTVRPQPRASNYWIRVEVQVNSRYRVCDSNPQDDHDSTWGEVQGQFRQCFFIKSGCGGRPVLSDRTVSISIDKLHANLSNASIKQ
jgi:hypothetical protein